MLAAALPLPTPSAALTPALRVAPPAADAPAPAASLDARTEALHALGHNAFWLAAAGAMSLVNRALRPGVAGLSLADFRALHRRLQSLLDEDRRNAASGRYPRSLLGAVPWGRYLRALPAALADAPAVLARGRAGRTDELPAGVDLAALPEYYRRTFHWQTDGWLSAHSARVYDLQVEVLFGGVADVMRRMMLPPLAPALRAAARPEVLDLACGTGHFLRQLRLAHPEARAVGLDLSAHYLDEARRVLGPDALLVAGAAERAPFADGRFQAVTSSFLFHELPRDVRRAVVAEAWRVLAPGGRFVVCDSAQLHEGADIAGGLSAFARLYHEPYYDDYLRDPLEALLAEAGFRVVASRAAGVSKVVVGVKLA